jgi:SAM-dependent methyltransferase
MKSCPICDSSDILGQHIQFVSGWKEYSLGRCNTCTGIFYENEFFFDFKENFDHNRSLKVYIEKTSDIEELITVGYNFFEQYGEKLVKGIDIGCGAGLLMDFSQKIMGKTMIGFEPSTHYSQEAKKVLGLNVVEDFFIPDQLAGEKMDFAVCFQVLQLVQDPVTLLKDINEVLTRGGAVLLSTPDNEGITANAQVASHLSALSPGVHRVIFNKMSLEIAFRKAGFQYVEVIRRNGQLFAIASDASFEAFDIFKPNRPIVLDYYIKRLKELPDDSLYYKGIWYRLFRYRIDNGQYEEGLQLLREADWFEVWAENEIDAIGTLDKLYELNSSADAVIYYYAGILFLNHLQKQDYAEKFFLLSFLLCRKIIQIQPDMSSIERDIIWLAKLHQVFVQLNQGKMQEANNELIFMLAYDSDKGDHLPSLPADIKLKAEGLLR